MASSVISNGALDVTGAAALTALLVQQTKFLVEYWIKPANPNHDAIIRLYVDGVATCVVIVAAIVSGSLNVHSGAAWFTAVVQGFAVALAAIAGYHLLNGLQPQTPSPVAGGPQAAAPTPVDATIRILNGATPPTPTTTAEAIPVLAPVPALNPPEREPSPNQFLSHIGMNLKELDTRP